MIYKYCCTSCGKRFDGEKIAFDLVEMLDMDLHISQDISGGNYGERSDKKRDTILEVEVSKGDGERKDYVKAAGDGPSFIGGKDAGKKNENAANRDYVDSEIHEIHLTGRTKNLKDSDYVEEKEEKKRPYETVHAFITSEELKEIAEAGGKQLKDGVESSITISLHQFLSYMTVGIAEKEKGRYANLPKDDRTITDAMLYSLSIGESKELAEIIAKKYWETINDRFALKDDVKNALRNLDSETGTKAKSEIESNTDNYEAIFDIIPLFYNNSDHLYTIKIKKEGHYVDIMRDQWSFRGYCTECRKPVLLHTGKYPHRVVGMLGAMSAGKTSMITAMTVEIEENSAVLGVGHVGGKNKLYDEAAKYRDMDYQLYKHDWAVGKTAAETEKGSYNASFFLTDSTDHTQSVILTLADIAGEKCYDQANDKLASDAFIKFPVLKNCDAYIICACINQKGYGNAEGKKVPMPPAAIKSIASEIYDRYYLEYAERIPPLCIVMTKADMAKENIAAGGDDNPFEVIRPLRKEYLFRDGLRILSSIYNAETDPNIRQSLKLCADTYKDMSKKTYTAILSAAAMGREAVKFPGISNEIGFNMQRSELGAFRRTRLLNVWEWILKVCGVVPVVGGYKFKEVPSYLEYYSEDQSHVYNIDNWEKRLKAVGCIGINQANSDRMMYRASMEAITWWERIRNQGEENARRAHILEVMPKNLSESIVINTRHD